MNTPLTLVTGATGFLGGRICARLVELGRPVIAMGRDTTRFPKLDPRLCRPVVADLADSDALAAACRTVDVVIHSAALASAWGDPRLFHEANVEGTRRILGAARAAGVRRFVHVSSSSVVFDNRDRFRMNESEPYPTTFLSPYGASKARSEEVVRGFEGIETVIVRPRAIFGPGDTSLLPRLVRAGMHGRLPIIGNGHNVQDLTFVDNVVHALVLACSAPAVVGHTYFVTNDESVKLWDVISEVFEGIGITPPKRRIPTSAAVALAGAMEALQRARGRWDEPALTRYGVALLGRNQTIDIAAAKRDLGYAPLVSMTDAVVRTIDALRSARA